MTIRADFFDVAYGIASPVLTVGNTVVTTTGADYKGILVNLATSGGTIVVYDNGLSASGLQIDAFVATAAIKTRLESSFVVKAKNGISVSVTGTDSTATVFYAPKG